jgi:hypothetical protein
MSTATIAGVHDGECGLCFMERRGSAGEAFHLLVVDSGRDEVQEIDVVTRTHVRTLFAGLLSGPRAIAAGSGLIAVAERKWVCCFGSCPPCAAIMGSCLRCSPRFNTVGDSSRALAVVT